MEVVRLSWVALGWSWAILEGSQEALWGLWSCSLLGFCNLNMQNEHFRKSAPGVGGGTILVAPGGSWGRLGSLLGRLEWLLAALRSQGSASKAILAIMGGQGRGA